MKKKKMKDVIPISFGWCTCIIDRYRNFFGVGIEIIYVGIEIIYVD